MENENKNTKNASNEIRMVKCTCPCRNYKEKVERDGGVIIDQNLPMLHFMQCCPCDRLRAMLEEASGGKTSNDESALPIDSVSGSSFSCNELIATIHFDRKNKKVTVINRQ